MATLTYLADQNPAIREILESALSAPQAMAALHELLAGTPFGRTSESAIRRWRQAHDAGGMVPGGFLERKPSVPVLEAQPHGGEFMALEARFEALRRTHDSVLRQLYEVKHKHADYLETVREAVQAATAAIHVPPVPPPARDARRKGEEVAVVLLSDLQTGKITPDYNTDICRERVRRYAEKIIRITNVQRGDHPVRHCRVALIGDVVEGVDIFPGQQWLIDSTLYRQVFESTPSIIIDFLRLLATCFDTVTVEAVQGNHGRIARRGVFGPEDNSDRMVYSLVRMLTRDDPRITVDMADPVGERAWYKIMEIGTYRALLIHGDQIRGAMGFPFYGLGKKVHSWASGGLPCGESFTDMYMGHYHQLAAVPLNRRMVWANGAVESTNTFAAETMAAQSEPSQWLLFVDPDKGRVTGSYAVRLLE